MAENKSCVCSINNKKHVETGVCLGGIGTGGVELRANGEFKEWNLTNSKPFGSSTSPGIMGKYDIKEPELKHEDSCFIIGTEENSIKTFRLLYNNAEDTDSWGGSSFETRIYRMPWLKQIQKIENTYFVPFTNLKFTDSELPVEINLEAFSPFIPHDYKNSSLPVAFFNFTVKNISKKEAKFSLAYNLKNFTGFLRNGKKFGTNKIIRKNKYTAVYMKPHKLPENNPSTGNLTMGLIAPASKISYLGGWNDNRDMWDSFYSDLKLQNNIAGKVWFAYNKSSSKDTITDYDLHGVLAYTSLLKPGEEEKFTFVLGWSFPVFIDNSGFNMGHKYNVWFKNSLEAVDYGIRNYKDLSERTHNFTGLLGNSGLPEKLKLSLNYQLNTFLKATWWDKCDNFGIWEGLGCCGLNTIDVIHYSSIAMLLFFPEFQKKTITQFIKFQNKGGELPHAIKGSFKLIDGYSRIDVNYQYVIQAVRDYIWTGDKDFLKKITPSIKKVLKLNERFLDKKYKLPVVKNKGITYDHWSLKGIVNYLSLLYIAMLVHIKKINTDKKFIKDIDSIIENNMKNFDKLFWNGEYYDMVFSVDNKKRLRACLSDQLNGQWVLYFINEKNIISKDKIKSTLNSVWKYNFKDKVGLMNGGDAEFKVEIFPFGQWETPWTGIEFAVSSLFIENGYLSHGLHIVNAVYDRYHNEGQDLNHIECGHHYLRPMSIWAVYLSILGLGYVAPDYLLKFMPKTKKIGLKSLFLLPQCFGTVEQSVNNNEFKINISLNSGKLKLKKIVLKNFFNAKNIKCKVEYDSNLVKNTVFTDKKIIEVEFNEIITFKDILKIRIIRKVQ